jgi:hypothetical protein
MSEFLLNYMRVAFDVTKAERAFAVDTNLNVLGTINISQTEIEAPYFKSIRKAINEHQVIITDNYTMTIDPAKAPVTNQSFPKLRFVLVLPVRGVGAICLDQSLRAGVTTKDKVDRLIHLVNRIVEDGETELNEEALLDRFNAM